MPNVFVCVLQLERHTSWVVGILIQPLEDDSELSGSNSTGVCANCLSCSKCSVCKSVMWVDHDNTTVLTPRSYPAFWSVAAVSNTSGLIEFIPKRLDSEKPPVGYSRDLK